MGIQSSLRLRFMMQKRICHTLPYASVSIHKHPAAGESVGAHFVLLGDTWAVSLGTAEAATPRMAKGGMTMAWERRIVQPSLVLLPPNLTVLGHGEDYCENGDGVIMRKLHCAVRQTRLFNARNTQSPTASVAASWRTEAERQTWARSLLVCRTGREAHTHPMIAIVSAHGESFAG